MSEAKIEGVPEGWRLVRIGVPRLGVDWVINHEQSPTLFVVETLCPNWPIIEKIEQPKQYRPFANAKEFEPHRDRWVSIQINGMLTKPVSYNEDRLFVGDMWFVWSDAFTHLRFDDGSPFGVEI